MGTRSLTVFVNHGEEIAVLYRQYDGYPSGMGKDLSEFLIGLEVVNGIPTNQSYKRYANGGACLAVQLIHYLKQKDAFNPCQQNAHGAAGNYYLYKAETRDVGEEWIYTLSCDDTPNIHVKVEEVASEKVYTFSNAKEFKTWIDNQKE
jgi:hypothetical protein